MVVVGSGGGDGGGGGDGVGGFGGVNFIVILMKIYVWMFLL